MIEGFARLLERHGIRFVIVGGQAVARSVPTATEDIDALVMVDDLGAAVEALREDPAVRQIDAPSSGMAGGRVRTGGREIDFDLLDPAAYSGSRSGREFFEFAHRHRSGSFAAPRLVWYMRLVAGDLAVYGSKIATDIRNGAPLSWLEDARRIARRFGTAGTVETGVRFVRELVRLSGASTGLSQY